MAQNADKYYQCPICFKEFSKPHTVKIHLRIHTGEKPFQCQYCPKAFTTSGNLGDHLRVHSTARMFKCKLCGAKFKRKATLKRHYEMHAKHRKSKNIQENADFVVTDNSEELLQTEIVDQPMYFSRFERSSEVVVSEHNEETVQTEIVHHPSHISLDDLQDQRCPTIELLFPPMTGKDDQENLILNHVDVKQENLDDFYDATILELTEEVEDIEGVQVKVYSLPKHANQSFKPPAQQTSSQEEKFNFSHIIAFPPNERISTISNPDTSISNVAVADKQSIPDPIQLDVSKRYGAYVTKMLKMIHPKHKQVQLIKELNKAIHEFVIENR